jgi:hypothetical protein
VTRFSQAVAAGACLLLAACSPLSTPSGPAREGPEPSWSVTVATGSYGPATVIGDVMIVPDQRALRGVSRAAGKELWRRELAEGYRYWIASELVVVREKKDGPLTVLDPATGNTKWSAEKATWDFVVYQRAVYSGACTKTACALTARDIQDGHPLWTIPASYAVSEVAIGAREPYAPAAGPYLAAGVGDRAKPWAAVDANTGGALPGRTQLSGWYTFAAGSLLVATQHDPPSGDQACTVTVQVVDGRTGKPTWSGAVFSGRRKAGECAKRLVHDKTGLTLIGAGSRIAAVDQHDRPQVFDLATGRTVWAGEKSGVPIDGDAQSVLVRDYADEGGLTLYDFETGKVRWTAEDPGLSGQSASWDSTVTGGLVAVSGADGDRPFVRVYDVNTGRQLGQFPGWLNGAGDDWVSVTHSNSVETLAFDVMRF